MGPSTEVGLSESTKEAARSNFSIETLFGFGAQINPEARGHVAAKWLLAVFQARGGSSWDDDGGNELEGCQ